MKNIICQPIPSDLKRLPFWALTVIGAACALEALLFLLSGRLTVFEVGHVAGWGEAIAAMGAFVGLPACVLWMGGYQNTLPAVTKWLALMAGVLIYALKIYEGSWNSAEGLGSFIPIVLGPLGAIELANLLWLTIFGKESGKFNCLKLLILMMALLGGLGISTRSALIITSYVFPATWDYHAYRIDAAFGAIPKIFAQTTTNQGPWLQALTLTVYSSLSASLFAVVGVVMRKRQAESLNIWRALVFPFLFAFVAYAWLPLSGPQYAFFDNQFPHAMPDPLSVAATQVVIPPAYRNGMPSMHLTGAILTWMLSVAMRSRLASLMSGLLVIGTVWATLATGEHYFIDLVVALPGAAFLGHLLIRPNRLRNLPFVLTSGICFIGWMILLKSVPYWLSVNNWAVQIFSAVSLISAVVALFQWVRFWALEIHPAQSCKPNENVIHGAVAPTWITVVFFISGVAGLMYEVVYAKALAVTFGGTALASYTVLATYMGGMAFGAWIEANWPTRRLIHSGHMHLPRWQ